MFYKKLSFHFPGNDFYQPSRSHHLPILSDSSASFAAKTLVFTEGEILAKRIIHFYKTCNVLEKDLLRIR